MKQELCCVVKDYVRCKYCERIFCERCLDEAMKRAVLNTDNKVRDPACTSRCTQVNGVGHWFISKEGRELFHLEGGVYKLS